MIIFLCYVYYGDFMEKLGINKKNIARSICAFLLFYFLPYIILYILQLCGMKLDNVDDAGRVIYNTVFSFITAIILFIIYRKDFKDEFKTFKKDVAKNIDCGFKCWFVGLIIMMFSNLFLNLLLKAGGANNEEAVQSLLTSLPTLMAINVCLFAPFNEEIAFRKTIKDVFKNKWIFVILSFLLFGGAHVISSAETLIDYLYIVPYGALGGAFAYAYYETDTIFTSMSMHMIHNTILVMLSLFIL